MMTKDQVHMQILCWISKVKVKWQHISGGISFFCHCEGWIHAIIPIKYFTDLYQWRTKQTKAAQQALIVQYYYKISYLYKESIQSSPDKY